MFVGSRCLPFVHLVVAARGEQAKNDELYRGDSSQRLSYPHAINVLFFFFVFFFTLPCFFRKVITGSYLMPKDRRAKRANQEGKEQNEEEEEEEEAEEPGGEVPYEFVKDYKFNIVHYVSFWW